MLKVRAKTTTVRTRAAAQPPRTKSTFFFFAFIRLFLSPTSLHNRSVNKSEDVGVKAFNPWFADFFLDLQVIVLKVLAVPVELRSAHSTVSP